MTQDLTGVLSLDLVGGSMCIDFANTVHNYDVGEPKDELQTYADLVRWSERAGALGRADVEQLLPRAKAHPRLAASALDEARSLRRVVFDVFSAVSDGEEPRPKDLETLSGAYAEAMQRGRLTQTREGYEWSWDGQQSAMNRMLWPIVRSAVDLLASEDLAKIRKCASEDCTWLFIDKSKNHSRRWCEMSSCGNRAKSRRHYRRTCATGGGDCA